MNESKRAGEEDNSLHKEGPLYECLREFQRRWGKASLTHRPEDVEWAVLRAWLVVSDRIVTRSRQEGVSEATARNVYDILRDVGSSLHVDGPGSPTAERLAEHLLEAFACLPDEVSRMRGSDL